MYLLLLLLTPLLVATSARAQVAPVLPTYAQAEAGETKSITVTSGTKSSVSFSNSSSLSTSVSTSGSSGTKASATSSYRPTGSFSSTISDSLVPASGISISTENTSKSFSDGSGTTESSTTGQATITGLESIVNLSFDSANDDATLSADVLIPETSSGDYMTGNAGAGLNLNNNLTADVETSSFSSSFMSSF